MTITTPQALADRAVGETIRLVAEHYVFPEVADRVTRLLRERLDGGAYRTESPEELADRVTADLQSVNGDLHLRLKYHAEPVPPEQNAAALAAMRRGFDAGMGGVPRIELREGGVAVLELAPLLYPLAWAAAPLSAALSLVAPARALVIDLRGNLGGDPDTVAFVCGYLLDERTHLNTMHSGRAGRPEQSWSAAHVPGARFGGTKPLYVLTGGRTFSGAEELAYDLQQLGRAVVVGESTRGGAHPREGWTVDVHLEATIPVGRAVNAVSGTNWEGTGVRPDVPCAEADALDSALALARERLASG